MKEYQRNHRTAADNGFAGAAQNAGHENKAENKSLPQEPATGSSAAASTKNSEGMVYLDIIPRFAL